MNTKALKTTMDWKTTGIIKGIKVKQLPHEGCAVYDSIGGDSYGYMCKNISDDGTAFDLFDDRGIFVCKAVLITRKNSQLCGRYVRLNANGRPDVWRSYGRLHGALGVTDKPGCGKTYLDPSF